MTTKSLKNLAEVPKEEQLNFIDSFDYVLTDLDGVLWILWKPFPDAVECMDNLRTLGKKIGFVTNYTGAPVSVLFERLKNNKLSQNIEELVNPYMAVVAHLKKINFQKKLYVVASKQYKENLKKDGFNVADDPPQEIEESVKGIFENIQDDEEIGAVLYDFDANLTYIKLQKVLTYLKRKDCLFFIAAADKALPVGPIGPLIGNKFFYTCLSEISGRQPVQLAKPSHLYNQYVAEKLNVTDPKRTLFIGDVINEDMGFGTVGGYQKLLVLSGTTKMDDIKDWKHPEEYKPTYYIQNLGELNKIIKTVHKL
uniref:4-nitrophenylphosphatase-like n=1 Tax=Diabrotica virgifera virgifera TaxID=50390 RepID=A0A6P7F0T8_DIAVI